MKEKDRYKNPFSGRKAPLPLSGLFLFAPSVDLKLAGHTVRELYAEEGHESLFKRMQQLNPTDEQAAARLVQEILALFPDGALAPVFEAASRGDAAALAYIGAMGDWELVLYEKQYRSAGPLTAHNRFILEVEHACKAPLALAQQQSMAEAVDLLSAHPLMQRFLWPQASAALIAAPDPLAHLPVQASVALEIRLSLIAVADVTLDEALMDETSHFTCLLPSTEEPTRNPTALFFAWMKRAAGAATIDAMLSNSLLGRPPANATTLKRWSNGSHHPRVEWLRLFAREVFGDPDYKPLWARYWAATYLNFIGHLAETCRCRALAVAGTPQEAAWAPWPKLPFDSGTIESWLAARYPVWLGFHRARQDNGGGTSADVPPR